MWLRPRRWWWSTEGRGPQLAPLLWVRTLSWLTPTDTRLVSIVITSWTEDRTDTVWIPAGLHQIHSMTWSRHCGRRSPLYQLLLLHPPSSLPLTPSPLLRRRCFPVPWPNRRFTLVRWRIATGFYCNAPWSWRCNHTCILPSGPRWRSSSPSYVARLFSGPSPCGPRTPP
ncbi:hypothetical protein QTP86_011323 [Hemibagrus guttatus]|nr:hypothetical protein QTP86_011323 [Hemibagrus guttatus]